MTDHLRSEAGVIRAIPRRPPRLALLCIGHEAAGQAGMVILDGTLPDVEPSSLEQQEEATRPRYQQQTSPILSPENSDVDIVGDYSRRHDVSTQSGVGVRVHGAYLNRFA